MKSRFSLILLLVISTSYLSAQSWNLVWSDEFDGTSLNPANWQHDIGTGAGVGLTGWGNNELQYYRDGSSNITVQDGVLSIIAKEESFGGQDYTSARIKTAGLQAWEQGKIEARIKLPIGQGIWPAFWMLRDDPFSDPEAQFVWPGEIDIVETVGHQPTIAHGTAHYGTPGDVLSNGSSYNLGESVDNDFHLYTIEWYENLIVWKLDGIQYHSLHLNDVSPNHWLFGQEYHALLNVAVGGNWPGSPDASTQFPVQMDVDYVRVYEQTSTVASVTFNVDMRCESGFSTVGIEGPSEELGAWCGGCIPLTDLNLDGIWTVTLDLPAGMPIEYKYSIDNFAGQENLIDDMLGGADCAPVTDFNAYANRLVTITEGAVFDDTYGSCEVCDPGNIAGCMDPGANNYNEAADIDDGSCTYDVTFNVDMNCYDPNNEEIETAAPHVGNGIPGISGPFCSFCGDISMTDDDEDGIWTIVLSLPAGEFEYKYIVDGFNGQENLINDMLDGAQCAPVTDFANYANRLVTVGAGSVFDDTYGICGECVGGELSGCMDMDAVNYDPDAAVDDGSCLYAVTFELDMTGVDIEFTTPEVNGLFNDWCGLCNPMTDDDGDCIWTATIDLPLGMTEFKFSVDDWTNEEVLTEGSECTSTTDGFTNRTMDVTGNMIYGPVVWNKCSVCLGDFNGDGEVGALDFIELNSAFGSSCDCCAADLNRDGAVTIDDFLIFNSLFGDSCPD